jgi:hypothetical protein
LNVLAEGAAASFGSAARDAIFALANVVPRYLATSRKSLVELARVQMRITTSSVRRVSKGKQENLRGAEAHVH